MTAGSTGVRRNGLDEAVPDEPLREKNRANGEPFELNEFLGPGSPLGVSVRPDAPADAAAPR